VALLRARLPALRLLVVGGETEMPDPAATPELGVLQQLAAELGITDRVQFVGRRQPNVLCDYYSAGDVAVTTPWYEPFGLTPLEGMACGRPVVGAAVGGIPFTVADGMTGYCVPPRDPEALAARLETLLTRPDLRARMGRAARARVEREFTWATSALRTAALYEALLAERQAGAARWLDGAVHATTAHGARPLLDAEKAIAAPVPLVDGAGLPALAGVARRRRGGA
jgi:glycosyltransferase involved in cell wall biosynthesis